MLSAVCTLQHQPSGGVLEALAAAIRPGLSTFKRQQLASCLDAFKALGFHPGNDLIQVTPICFALSSDDRAFAVCELLSSFSAVVSALPGCIVT